MMLQDVNKNLRNTQASSLYCVWIQPAPGSPLVAIWIDSEMRTFESQYQASHESIATSLASGDAGPDVAWSNL